MTWLKVAHLLLTLAVAIFRRYQTSAAEKVGEDRQALRQLKEMQAISAMLKDIDELYKKKSDDEIRKDIEAKGDFRD